VSVELPAELVAVAISVDVELSEELVVSEDVELVRLVQLSIDVDVTFERSVSFRLAMRP